MTLPPERIGDKGQRFVVQTTGWPSPDAMGWQNAAYADTHDGATKAMGAIAKCPGVKHVRIRDSIEDHPEDPDGRKLADLVEGLRMDRATLSQNCSLLEQLRDRELWIARNAKHETRMLDEKLMKEARERIVMLERALDRYGDKIRMAMCNEAEMQFVIDVAMENQAGRAAAAKGEK